MSLAWSMKTFPIMNWMMWEGPFVRLALMIAAFLISWAIMFFCAAWENLSVSDWTEYDAGIYAAPDPAGYPDVCGNL